MIGTEQGQEALRSVGLTSDKDGNHLTITDQSKAGYIRTDGSMIRPTDEEYPEDWAAWAKKIIGGPGGYGGPV